MRTLSLALALAVTCELTAAASPVDTTFVPADAGAVIHVDLDAIKASKIYAAIGKKLGGDPFTVAVGQADDVKSKLILGALTGAHSVTVWLDEQGEQGVAIILGVDTTKLAKVLETFKGHTTEKLGKRTLHRLGKDHHDACLVMEGSWIMVSEKPEPIARALATLDGAKPRLDKARMDAGAPGAILVVAVLGRSLLDRVSHEAQSRVLGKGGLDSAKIVVAERSDKIVARLQVTMRTPEDAMQVEKIAAGLVAMGSLAADSDMEKRLLGGITASRTDKVVALQLELSQADAASLIQEIE